MLELRFSHRARLLLPFLPLSRFRTGQVDRHAAFADAHDHPLNSLHSQTHDISNSGGFATLTRGPPQGVPCMATRQCKPGAPSKGPVLAGVLRVLQIRVPGWPTRDPGRRHTQAWAFRSRTHGLAHTRPTLAYGSLSDVLTRTPWCKRSGAGELAWMTWTRTLKSTTSRLRSSCHPWWIESDS